MLSTKSDSLIKSLSKIGLSKDESYIYLTILDKSITSPLEISRLTGISRTKVYRILDKLISKSLISQQLNHAGTRFTANPLSSLESFIDTKAQEIDTAKETLPELVQKLNALAGKQSKEVKVLYYKGIEGLKQVAWNSLKAKEELLTMEVSDMNAFLDKKFAEKIRQEIVNRKIFTRNLTNRKHIQAWTEIKQYPQKYWEVRHIDPKEFEITFDILIYNDVYCIYDFNDKEYFCVEIYNEKLVKMQKQIYEFIWKNAKEMKIISDQGEASI